MQHFRYSNISTKLLNDYTSIARCDETAAVRILGMLLPSDGTYYSYLSARTLEVLAELARSHMDGFEWVLSHTKLPDEITPAQRPLLVLLALEEEDPAAAKALQSLPWVQTVAANTNYAAYNISRETRPRDYPGASAVRLAEMALGEREVFQALLEKPWLQDDYASTEYAIIEEVFLIGLWDAAAALRVLEMPFMETPEGQGGATAAVLGILHDQLTQDQGTQALQGSAAVEQLSALLELTGDITNEQLGAVALKDLGMRIPDARSAVEALPWIQDGIDPSEQWAVIVLRREALRAVGMEAFRVVLTKPWVQDGLESSELDAFATIFRHANYMHETKNEAAAMKILAMPFLDKLDEMDLLALRSLSLQWDKLPQILAHPGLGSGITDDLTDIVAIIARYQLTPDYWKILLDSRQTVVKRRSITLPLAGEVALSVVWPGGPSADLQASWTLDRVEHAVRTQEAFMGLPFPTPHVVLLVAEDPVSKLGGNGDKDGLPRISPIHYTDQRLTYHEVAHGYWHGSGGGWLAWISEGGATTLEMASMAARYGSAMPEPLNSCSLANTMNELENDILLGRYPGGEVYASSCLYHLGTGMFLDLYHRLGYEAFRQGFAELNLRVRDPETPGECEERHVTYCLLREAFVTNAAAPQDAQTAEEIINRRYWGTAS